MKINLFTPPKFKKSFFDLDCFNKKTNKQWQYSSFGRASLYHILKPLNIDKILVPVYICSTILEPLKKLKIEPIYYDLDIEDLNASIKSIDIMAKKYNVKTLIVASMYGNPANLVEIEKFCKEKELFMIDDAAQSFGSTIENRLIGTFGNAGFFSFSPGKPTAGHMGSFFWTDKSYEIIRTRHCLSHYIRWVYFYVTRYNTYKSMNLFKKMATLLYIFTDRYTNLYNDDICKFENSILGGILNEKFEFRKDFHNKFLEKFSKANYFRTIKSIRGVPNNHKIVICFNTKDIAKQFIQYMNDNGISVLNGYNLLSNNLLDLPNAKSIENKIVELPIEDCEKRMNYLFKKVEEFYGS